MKIIKHYQLFLMAITLITVSCNVHNFRQNFNQVNDVIHHANTSETKPFLKVHFKNGFVCVLTDSWQIDTLSQSINGYGSIFDVNRYLVSKDVVKIPIENVALFETNTKLNDTESGRILALALLAGVDVAVGIVCLTNPKACFGSCPTFYFNKDDNFHYADAEGFSNAISPSMEYGDIDALNTKNIQGDSLTLTMKNEALETHCVNNVKLLAYPINENERVYQTPTNDFYLCKNNYAVNKAIAKEGDITALVKNADMQERFSLTDEQNLKSKEEVFLTFNNVKNTKDLGLIINFRQTLLTTYLFYSAMGYMGNEVGDIFAQLETDSQLRNNFDYTKKQFGAIGIYALNEQNNQWELQNTFHETGPIAINKQIVAIKNSMNPSSSTVKLKVVLNKGLWRIDYLALTNITKTIEPIELNPTQILNKGKIDHEALASIENPNKHLISMPGSEYEFKFKFPENYKNYELFLYSKGYYLEWMRQHWIKDKNIYKLHQMVKHPEKYLKNEAKSYKKYESMMEQEFWNSKVNTKTFSYDGN